MGELSYKSKFSLAGLPSKPQTQEYKIDYIQAQINLTTEAADNFIREMMPRVLTHPQKAELGNWWARVPDELRLSKQAVEQDLNEMRLILDTGTDEHFASLEEKTKKGLDAYIMLLVKTKLKLDTML